MGLAVVHGIVKKHGGAVTLESEPGKGTRISLFFPLLQDGRPERQSPSLEPLPKGTERVLLVDDEEAQVRTLQAMLERLGYCVVGKTDPREALALFRTEPKNFDLVVTDQTMPRIPGNRLARMLLEIRSDIPIVLCTGFSEMIDEEGARAAGIREFAMKPFTVGDMAQVIRRALGKREDRSVISQSGRTEE